MPDTLHEWLLAWNEFESDAERSGYNTTASRALPSFRKVQGFQCYDPRNLQSQYAQFHPKEGDDRASLEKKIRVLGHLSRMDESVCVIAIEYSGFVPPACNCTGESEPEKKVDESIK